jgi:hypothetical protein
MDLEPPHDRRIAWSPSGGEHIGFVLTISCRGHLAINAPAAWKAPGQ